MKINDIRRIINAYSRKTSGHPFADYGNDVKITVNDDCTIYECMIQTQYEDRDTAERTRPYRGWNVAPRKYFSLRDIDPWRFNLKTPEDFIDRKTTVEIEGSASVSQCGSCSGAGSTTCYTCHGKGKDVCPTCHGDYLHLRCSSCGGDGKENCPTCHGTGHETCTKCKGKGFTTENVSVWKTHYDYNLKKEVGGYEWVKKDFTCTLCYGKGYKTCFQCKGRGTQTCKKCGGEGTVKCTACTQGYVYCKTCGGKGQLVCRICEGAGQNELRYIVSRTLNQETLRGYVCDKRVREFAETTDFDFDGVDFNTRAKALEGELYPEDVRCSSKLAKLLAKTEPDSGIILFQEATVSHVESTVIEYEYKGATYGGIICNGVFFPDGSPIEEWTAEVVDKAEKSIRRGSSAKSLQMLDQAEQAGADRNTINNLRSMALRKLGNLRDAGTSLAFWLMVLFFSPVLYNFYYQLNPVALWAIVTNNPGWRFFNFVPLCQTLIFLLVAIALRFMLAEKSDNSAKYSSIWQYFAKGFFTYLLACLVAVAILIFVNYLGLSILTTFIMGIAVIIVAFVISLPFLIVRWFF